MSARKLKYFIKHAEMMNELTFIETYNMLKGYFINLFEYKNLPPTIPEEVIEKTLFEKGKICFFKDRTLDILLALPVNTSGFNVYGDPLRYNIFSSHNGYTAYRRPSTAVIMYNNRLRSASAGSTQLYANRISESQRTADVNVLAQKTPIMIRTSQDQVLTMENLFNQYTGNTPLIIGNKEQMTESQFEKVELSADFKAKDIMTYKRELLNEFFTTIGIDNANTDKKERMITGEIESNNEQVERALLNMLISRQDAVKKINAMFKTKIEVAIRLTESEKIKMANTYATIKNTNAEAIKFMNESEEDPANE